MGQWNEAKIGEIAEVKGGKRIPKGRKLIKEPNSHPYIRIRNLGKTKYMQLNTDYEYVDEETQQMIARYIVNQGDILISVVGTIGLVGIVYLLFGIVPAIIAGLACVLYAIVMILTS